MRNEQENKSTSSLINTVVATGTTPISVFTVTGDVALRIIGICKASCTSDGAITIELGVTSNTAVLIAQIADAKDLITNEIWHDATPDATIELSSVYREYVISNGQDVILTTTGTLTAGTIAFYCEWYALSANGSVTVA